MVLLIAWCMAIDATLQNRGATAVLLADAAAAAGEACRGTSRKSLGIVQDHVDCTLQMSDVGK